MTGHTEENRDGQNFIYPTPGMRYVVWCESGKIIETDSPGENQIVLGMLQKGCSISV
jgi:hypothetical protein